MEENLFENLKNFINNKMRMSHIYQPLMLKEIIKSGGKATRRQIASEILNYDESQIKYFSDVVRDLPARVLSKHKIINKKGDNYWIDGFELLTENEINQLIELCEKKLNEYIKKRGDDIWEYRTLSGGVISGSMRYELLKEANGKCLLCGISAKERPLDVDHIVPRSKGGSDDKSNLQVLCSKCNRGKSNKDDTDFRNIE